MAGEYGHPSSWRLHRAHPALGLEEMEDDWLWPPERHELGVAWLALSPEEQRRREMDCAVALQMAARPGSGWDVELVEEDGVLGVWMDRWKAPALQREFLDRVGEAARGRGRTSIDTSPEQRRRDVDRRLRAHVLVAWNRHAFKAFIAAMALAALLGLNPWGDGGIGAHALRIAVAVVVVIALGSLIERWYRRLDRKPE